MAQKKITLMSVLCLLSSVNVFAGRGSTEVSSSGGTAAAPMIPAAAPAVATSTPSAPPSSNNDGQNSGMSAQQMAALGLGGSALIGSGVLGGTLYKNKKKNNNTEALRELVSVEPAPIPEPASVVLEGARVPARPQSVKLEKIPNINHEEVVPKYNEITRKRAFSAPLPITPVLPEVNDDQVALENDEVEKIDEEKVNDEYPKAAPDHLEEAKRTVPEFAQLIKLHDKHGEQLKNNPDISLGKVQKKQSEYKELHEKVLEKSNMLDQKSEIAKKITTHIVDMNNKYVQKKNEIVNRQFPERTTKEHIPNRSHEVKI